MRMYIKIISLILILLIMGVFVGINPQTPLFDMDYSTIIKDKNGKILRVFLNDNEQWRMPSIEKEIPYKLKTSILNFEDKRFYSHFGIDLKALSRAVFQNITKGRRISGASTITMQLMRLSKEKDRNIINKIVEMIQAVKTEFKYSKAEILKLYVDNAPYGGNIVGYRAASYRYFGKEANMLTWAESTLLAVLPNSPSLMNPNREQDKLLAKRNRLLKKLYIKNIIDKETYELALEEDIPRGQHDFPFYAPHFARRLYEDYKHQELKTSIDLEKQKEIMKIAKAYNRAMSNRGIENLAVIVAEKQSGKVRAYIGSNDFNDIENSGMIDGVDIDRSSGSILKPFLYALAIDEGYIQPSSLLEDIPVNYGSYSPYNANKSFRGLVEAKDALTRSLNAPAVRLLEEYSVKKFYDFMKNGGITTLFRTPKSYGLPLILGGAEIRLSEITNLYRALGNYGEFSKLSFLENENRKETKRIFSKGAAYLVLDILKDVKRPGLNHYWEEYDSKWEISWKTGTSYGNRDAWAVGVSNQWVIGVWVGNFSGKGEEGISGIQAAAPLLFRVFNYLPKRREENNFKVPVNDLKKIKVSKNTGYRLSKEKEELTELKELYVPKNAKPLKKSPYEKLVFVNEDESEILCSLCWKGEKIHKKLIENYPPIVVNYLTNKNLVSKQSIQHRKTCENRGENSVIDIVYPKEGSILYLPKISEGSLTVKVERSSEGRLFWYIDGVYNSYTTSNDSRVVKFKSGWHRIYLMDEDGNSKTVKFYVKSN